MKNRPLIVFLFLIFLFSSCANLKVVTHVTYPKTQTLEKVVLMPVMIGPISQPIIPLLDAGIFNAKTNEIAHLIMEEQKKAVVKYRDHITKAIETSIGCEVVTSNDLINDEAYGEFRSNFHKGHSLAVDNANYPFIVIHETDINPFSIRNGDAPSYFEHRRNGIHEAKEVCEALGMDAIAISFTRMRILGVSGFGIQGNIRLETAIYLISKEGTMLAYGYAHTKPRTISGRDLISYSIELNNFPFLFDLMVKDITK